MLIGSFILLEGQTATTPKMGNGSEENPYQIASLEDLYWIAATDDVVTEPNRATRWSSHYIQTANINASETKEWFGGEGWEQLGYYTDKDNNKPFIGNYDGKDYIIDNLYINRPDKNCNALFSYAKGSEINNLSLTNVDIIGGSNIGGLVGVAIESILSNCYSTGSVKGEGSSVGGLVGTTSSNTTINNCYSTVSVKGDWFVGGLVGKANESAISDSYSLGSVTGTGDNVGGFVGAANECTISSSYSTGRVPGVDGNEKCSIFGKIKCTTL